MVRYKGYSKKNTSQRQMRIDKREELLSVILLGRLGFMDVSLTQRKYDTPGKKLSWKQKNLTTLSIQPKEDSEFENMLLNNVKKTEWLKNYDLVGENKWENTRKNRIIYKWLRGKGGKTTLERVMKYFYSFKLPAYLYYYSSYTFKDSKSIFFTFPKEIIDLKDINLLKKWFFDIHDIQSIVLDYDDVYQMTFDKEGHYKFYLLLDQYYNPTSKNRVSSFVMEEDEIV